MSAAPDDLLPIREVARMTGVNAVTLRAWERRYGLITPHRTLKGHRLYSGKNVQQIQDILTWIGRGVAVGQVKELLHAPQPWIDTADSLWHERQQHFIDALLAFDAPLLEHIFSQAMASGSAQQVAHHLVEPALQHLQQRWQGQFGSQLEEVFCHTWLHNCLATRLHQVNPAEGTEPVLLVNLSERPFEPSIWLLAMMLHADGVGYAMLEWEVPASELSLIAERTDVAAIVLFSSQALPVQQLRRQLPKLVQHQSRPVMLAGPAAVIHQQVLIELGVLTLPAHASLAYPLLLAQLRTSP